MLTNEQADSAAADVKAVPWNEVTLDEVAEILRLSMRKGFQRTYYLVGPRGVGKTSVAYQASKEEGYDVILDRLQLKDPTDVRGVLCRSAKDDKAVYLSNPDYEPCFDTTKKVLLFGDEHNQSPGMVQSAYNEVALEHAICGRKFSSTTMVTLAGNREDENANITMPDKTMQSRVIWLYVRFDFDVLFKYAMSVGFHPLVLGYLKESGEKSAFAPVGEGQQDYFGEPLPRTWEFVSDVLKAFYDDGSISPRLIKKQIAGCVGVSEATQFWAWTETAGRLRPLIESIVNGANDTAPTMGQQFFVVHSLVERFRKDLKLATRLLDYCKAIKTTHGEMGGFMLQTARNVDWDALRKSVSYKKTAADYYSILV